MKKLLSILFLSNISFIAKSQKTFTYEIKLDTTISINIDVAINKHDTVYKVSKYFQFQIVDVNKDSISISWTTIKENGDVKNKGIQKMPSFLINLVGDSISVSDLNSIIKPKWGLEAIRRID